MGGKARMEPGYPYPFVGHGVGYARKRIDCFVAFQEPVPPELCGWIEKACPRPLAVQFGWTPRGLAFGSDDGIHERVIAEYSGEPIEDLPGSEQWAALAADVDRWLGEISERVEIACVVWPLDEEFGHRTDEWHDWSMPRVPTIVKQHLTNQGDEAAWFAERATAAWKASEAPPKSSAKQIGLAELAAAWKVAVAGDGMQLELRFAERWGLTSRCVPELRDTWYAAAEAKDWILARRVCEQVLAQDQPVQYRYQWLVHHVEALLALGELDTASEALPSALLFASFYDNDAILALLRYYLEVGDREQAAVVYHAGVKLGTHFKVVAHSPGGALYGELKDGPPKPPKVMQRFGEIYREWVAPAWQPHTMAWGDILTARSNFKEVHKSALKLEIKAAEAALSPWKRRADGVRLAVESAETAVLDRALGAFLTLPIDSRSSDFLGDLAIEIGENDPKTADKLFRCACAFWRINNRSLTAYFELCVAHDDLSLPDEIVHNLPFLARLGGYGTCELLRSALRYYRARQKNAEAQAVETLYEAYECRAR